MVDDAPLDLEEVEVRFREMLESKLSEIETRFGKKVDNMNSTLSINKINLQ